MAESRGNPAILRISLVLDLERVLMRAVGVVSIREMRKLGDCFLDIANETGSHTGGDHSGPESV